MSTLRVNTLRTVDGTFTVSVASLATGGGGTGVTDHGLLAGLGDDDHPQYLNEARGDARYATADALTAGLAGKQNTLVSGTSIKTINGSSLLGSGDLSISGGGSTAWDDVTGKPSTFAPSAHTHVIADVTGLQTALDGKGNVTNGTGAVVDDTFVAFDGTTGTAITASGKAIPSGDVVGTTDTQTLTNKTLTSPTVTGGTVDTFPIGYRNVPQVSQSAAYTAVLTDAGKHILHPSADTTARTFTIPANSSVAYPIGTALTFVNQASAGVVTIAITTDTMRLAGAGTTGSRTLAANGIATALKITTTEWIISGTGLT